MPGGRTTTLSVNGKQETVSAVEGTMLLYVLRDQLGLKGPKFGCGLPECAACAVLANGKQIRSCVTPLSTVGSQKIVTLEGLADSYDGPGKTEDGQLHPLQQAWIDEQVPRCGYCQSGMIIQAADLLRRAAAAGCVISPDWSAPEQSRAESRVRGRRGVERAGRACRLERDQVRAGRD